MRNTLCSILLLVAASSAASTDSTGVVTGRVSMGVEREPGGYANVIVVGTRRGAQADSTGAFRISLVPAGIHTLRILRPWFEPLSVPISVSGEELDVGEIVLGPNVRLHPDPVAIGSKSGIDPGSLIASIRPSHSPFHVGEAPTFEVRIRNAGGRPVKLVRSVDGSDSGASPEVTVRISGPEGGFRVRGFGRCGNRNGASLDDFVLVMPNEEFDPWSKGWRDARLTFGRFEKPGEYAATFRYVTTNGDPRTWMHQPGYSTVPDSRLVDLLESIPAVELEATTQFRVEP